MTVSSFRVRKLLRKAAGWAPPVLFHSWESSPSLWRAAAPHATQDSATAAPTTRDKGPRGTPPELPWSTASRSVRATGRDQNDEVRDGTPGRRRVAGPGGPLPWSGYSGQSSPLARPGAFDLGSRLLSPYLDEWLPPPGCRPPLAWLHQKPQGFRWAGERRESEHLHFDKAQQARLGGLRDPVRS